MTSVGEAVYLACERIDQKLTKTQRILFFFFLAFASTGSNS